MRTDWQNSTPVICGISQSETTTRQLPSLSLSSASRPLAAVVTLWPARCRASWRRRRAISSSSAISTSMGGLLSLGLWQVGFYGLNVVDAAVDFAAQLIEGLLCGCEVGIAAEFFEACGSAVERRRAQ